MYSVQVSSQHLPAWSNAGVYGGHPGATLLACVLLSVECLQNLKFI